MGAGERGVERKRRERLSERRGKTPLGNKLGKVVVNVMSIPVFSLQAKAVAPTTGPRPRPIAHSA